MLTSLRLARMVMTLLAPMAPSTGGSVTPAEGDLDAMQGRWTTNSFAGAPATFAFDGPTLTVTAAEVEYTIVVSLDEQAQPEKTIDLRTEQSTNLGAEGKVSPGIYKFDGEGTLVICFRATGDRPTSYETRGFEQWLVELTRTTDDAGEASPADAEAPLPEGWPEATDPGAIEVKRYPAYRSAILRKANANHLDQDDLFFPLFDHIQRNGIAMTAPVVMTYPTRVVELAGAVGVVSMEFLYRRPDQGEVGPGVGQVRVEDHPPATYVCLGVRGAMDEETIREAIETLRGWLRDHAVEWSAAGEPRRLGYHGPDTPVDRQLNEVQIPIRPAADGAATTNR